MASMTPFAIGENTDHLAQKIRQEYRRILAALTASVSAAILDHRTRTASELTSLVFLLCTVGDEVPSAKEAELWDVLDLKLRSAIEKQPMAPGLFGGIAGILYACEHASRADKGLHDLSEELRQLNPGLVSFGATSKAADYDLISGACGILALACFARGFSADDLDSIVTNILRGKASIPAGENLGIAHGLPGTILVLLRARKHLTKNRRNEVDSFIRAACERILQAANSDNFASRYPYFAGTSGTSRLAWCYGDLAVAYTLCEVHEVLPSEVLRSEIQISCDAIAMRTVQNSGCTDLNYCHGAIGVVHMIRRVLNFGDHAGLRTSLMMWMDYVLSQLTQIDIFQFSLDKLDLLDSPCGALIFAKSGVDGSPNGLSHMSLID